MRDINALLVVGYVVTV